MRAIQVTGSGRLNVKPDLTRVVITLEGKKKDYGKTIEKSNEDTNEMRKLVSSCGLDGKDLKTISFDISSEYENGKLLNSGKRKLIGFKYKHRLKIEFGISNKLLGKLLYRLSKSPLHPEFKIIYTVKDPELVKNQLIGKAVRDADAKAKVLAEAAGVELKALYSIDYSWHNINLELTMMDIEDSTYFSIDHSFMSPIDEEDEEAEIEFEPQEIKVTDEVTVIWEIQ